MLEKRSPLRTLENNPSQLNDGVVWVLDNPKIDVFLKFELNLVASHLKQFNYTPYQYELYAICKRMRDEGSTFPYIAHWLNSNGYTSARGKVFKNPHIHSILKKKNIADNRMNKRYEPNIENLHLVFSHKTHTR